MGLHLRLALLRLAWRRLARLRLREGDIERASRPTGSRAFNVRASMVTGVQCLSITTVVIERSSCSNRKKYL